MRIFLHGKNNKKIIQGIYKHRRMVSWPQDSWRQNTNWLRWRWGNLCNHRTTWSTWRIQGFQMFPILIGSVFLSPLVFIESKCHGVQQGKLDSPVPSCSCVKNLWTRRGCLEPGSSKAWTFQSQPLTFLWDQVGLWYCLIWLIVQQLMYQHYIIPASF